MDYKASFAAAIFLFLHGLHIASCQNKSRNPLTNSGSNCAGCERVAYLCAGGMPGIPGANGMPGMPGPYGARGDKGDSGAVGNPGSRGPRGDKGDRGSRGQNGSSGKTGPHGAKGNKGEQGNSGTKGNAGQKGDAAAAGPISAANWKQCVWNNINDGRDSGKIKECSFNKLQGSSALKVSWQGVLRAYGDARCNRWYFKFNGNECSGPMTIEAVVYNDWPSGNPNLHHHRSFEGYCENLPRGAITVELWVGSCPSGNAQGDASTGWRSVSRIMVEEVPRSQ